MKSVILSVVCVLIILVGSQAVAEDSAFSISANVALTNDYVWRGVSQSDEDLSIQGGFDLGLNGLYLGVWGANVDFDDPSAEDADMEFDTYLGYANEVGDFGYDLGVIGYFYPGTEADLDWVEAYATVSFKYLSFGLYYSNEVFGSDLTGIYLTVGGSHEFENGVGFSVEAGQYSFDEELGGPGVPDSYLTWTAGVSKSFGAISLGAAYVGTNNDGEELFGSWAGDRVVVTLSASIG